MFILDVSTEEGRDELLAIVLAYDWPGDETKVVRAITLMDGRVVTGCGSLGTSGTAILHLYRKDSPDDRRKKVMPLLEKLLQDSASFTIDRETKDRSSDLPIHWQIHTPQPAACAPLWRSKKWRLLFRWRKK